MKNISWQLVVVIGYIKNYPKTTTYYYKTGMWFHIATTNERGSVNPALIKCCSTDSKVNSLLLTYGTPGAAVVLKGVLRHVPMADKKDINNYLLVDEAIFISTPSHKGQFDLEAFCKVYGLEKVLTSNKRGRKRKES